MKNSLLLIPFVFSAVIGCAIADPVRDRPDLHAAHEKVKLAIQDLERAQAANQYDMGGHAAKAEKLLREAEHEMHEAVEARRDH